jgi:hypothetical protein
MIGDKKTTSPFASKFMVNSIINFKHVFTIAGCYEKKLNQKNNIDFSKTNSYFNCKICYNLDGKSNTFKTMINISSTLTDKNLSKTQKVDDNNAFEYYEYIFIIFI